MPLLLLFGLVAVVVSAAVFIAPVVIMVVCVRAARAGRRAGDAGTQVEALSAVPAAVD